MLSTALDNARVLDLTHQAVEYQRHGFNDRAERCFTEALDFAEAIDGFDGAQLANVRNGLAGLRWEQQRHDDALALYLTVLATRETLFSASHQLVGQTLQTLGNCYLELDRFSDAEQVLERAVQVYREDTPDDLGPVGACLVSLGMAHLQQEHLAEAHRAFSEALGIYRVQRPLDEQVIAVLEEQVRLSGSKNGFLGKVGRLKFW